MVEFIFNNLTKTLVCELNGRFGAEVNELFSARLTEKIEVYTNSVEVPGKLMVFFDLKNVTFIASAFIRTCLAISRQVDAENFRIINASPVIKKTFKIAGLDEMLHVT